MNLTDWYKTSDKADELESLLNNPVLKEALEIIERANTPVFRPGVSAHDLATVHAFQAGIHHVRRTLKFLTQPPPKPGADLPEWMGEHVLPDHLRTPEN